MLIIMYPVLEVRSSCSGRYKHRILRVPIMADKTGWRRSVPCLVLLPLRNWSLKPLIANPRPAAHRFISPFQKDIDTLESFDHLYR